MNKKILIMGTIAGVIYFVSMVFQTYGLETTTAGKAGFITGLSTVIVPFLAYLTYKKPLDKRLWVAVGISIIGMACLLLEGESGMVIGDWLVLICAFFFALYIVINDKFARLIDVYLYSLVQMAVITSLCFLFSFLLNETHDFMSIEPSIVFWTIMIYVGIVVTTFTFLFQNWGQQHLEPSKTAIIFTLEPVFAVLFAYLIGNEVMTVFGWVGCGLVFIAILITVLKNENNETP